jgi:hypothetical protein
VADTTENNSKGDFKRRLAQKALMPIVATAASAAAGYAAKKGPHLFEEKVLPKLKQTAGGAGDAAENLPSRAKAAVSSVGDLAERAKDAVPIGGGSDDGRSSRRSGSLSRSDLERHVKQRAEARAARRKTTAKR